jgi:thiol-disulfide isomerase/thioredoxin
MKNPSLLIVAAIVLMTGVVGSYFLFKKNNPSTAVDSIQSNVIVVASSEPTSVGQSEQSQGRYTPYSSETFTNVTTSRRVLFFYANWCPTCKPADESFAQNITKIPADVTLIRVNYNDTDTEQAEKELAKKYGVTYQHTFVQIDEQGNEVAKWNGGKIEELLKNLK